MRIPTEQGDMEPIDYQYKSEPYDHQHKCFMATRDIEAHFIDGDTGTGKTKILIDTACWHYINGRINCLVVFAPNDVHTNWIARELPAHVPDYVDYVGYAWTGKTTKKEQREIDALFNADGKLKIIAINYEAVLHRAGALVQKLLRLFDVFMVLDESHRVKTPAGKVRLRINAFAKHTKFRRIATGTFLTQGPFDAFAQYYFLDPEFFGFYKYSTFKAHFGEFERGYNRKTQKEYDELVSYKNMDQFYSIVSAHSYKMRKKDCLDLPDKVYVQFSLALAPVQRRHYDFMRDELLRETARGTLRIKSALEKILRLHQVTGGFVDNQLVMENPPKLACMLERIRDSQAKAIIFCHFKPEIELVAQRLRQEYGQGSVVEFHGDVGKGDRAVSIDTFQSDPAVRFFVAQSSSGGIGITLTAATEVHYYSNSYRLDVRIQSEDRAHRIGQENKVTYYDYITRDTVDVKIIAALIAKKRIIDEAVDKCTSDWLGNLL